MRNVKLFVAAGVLISTVAAPVTTAHYQPLPPIPANPIQDILPPYTSEVCPRMHAQLGYSHPLPLFPTPREGFYQDVMNGLAGWFRLIDSGRDYFLYDFNGIEGRCSTSILNEP